MWLALNAFLFLVVTATLLRSKAPVGRSEVFGFVFCSLFIGALLLIGTVWLHTRPTPLRGPLGTALFLGALLVLRGALLREAKSRGGSGAEGARRAEVATRLRDTIRSAGVREAWTVIEEALSHAWLADAEEVRKLIGKLEVGDGMQLMEECSIDTDDEAEDPDRISLYLVSTTWKCSRSELIFELTRLAAALDDARAS